MGGTMALEDKIINNTMSQNELLLKYSICDKTIENKITTVQPFKKYFVSPILISRFDAERTISKLNIQHVLKNLKSFKKVDYMQNIGAKIKYANNFEDSVAIIDLLHDDYQTVHSEQDLI
jgi:hypothetical protein